MDAMSVSLNLRQYVYAPLEWGGLVAERYVFLGDYASDEGLFAACYLASNPGGGSRNPNLETFQALGDIIRNNVFGHAILMERGASRESIIESAYHRGDEGS